MKLLAPLGLIGLIGIVILFIIYIIRPNFQQKNISSTYVWKMSLRYKKKRVPMSKLRNLLLIFCQVLILSLAAFIITQPNKVLKEPTTEREVIAIIDSSASMLTKTDDYTRFERAYEKALKLSEEVFAQEGIVSVLVASNKPYFLAQRVNAENSLAVTEKINELVSENKCSYGTSDIDGAIALCEDVLLENPDAQIYLYTDNSYSHVPSSVIVENVSEEGEWNAAILNARAEIEDGYFTFFVEVACYGASAEVELTITVSGANAADKTEMGETYEFSSLVRCPDGIPQTVIFRNENAIIQNSALENETLVPIDKLRSYQRVWVTLNEADSFTDDNNFYIYGGQKEVMKILYASYEPETFSPSLMYVLKSTFANLWYIDIDELKEQGPNKPFDPPTKGYDLYIYEHRTPEVLPTDGSILLINPSTAPAGSGISLGNEIDYRKQLQSLTEETQHELLKSITADYIGVSRHRMLERFDSGYEKILSCNGNPVLIAKNEGANKIAVMTFGFQYSNFSMLPEWALFLRNLINYFMPATVSGNAFEVNEKVSLNARGDVLYVDGNVQKTFESFPSILDLDLPGTYDLTQTTYFGKDVSESIYVRIPASESNINAVYETIAEPAGVNNNKSFYKDLLLYFALALVIIELAEWFLQSREGM